VRENSSGDSELFKQVDLAGGPLAVVLYAFILWETPELNIYNKSTAASSLNAACSHEN
jgi:hypothetical protein